jgi:hypothetical protein
VPGRRYELVADSAHILELEEPFGIKLAVPDLWRRGPVEQVEQTQDPQ